MYEVTLTFRDKKIYNKFLRNLEHDKGTVIKPVHLVEGAGIFSNLRKSKLARSVATAVAKEGLKQTQNYLSNSDRPIASQLAGIVGSHAINTLNSGEGFLDVVKKARKTLAPAMKAVAPIASQLATNAVLAKTGNPMVAKLAGDLTNVAMNSGGGGRGRPKKGSAEAKAKMALVRARRTGIRGASILPP